MLSQHRTTRIVAALGSFVTLTAGDSPLPTTNSLARRSVSAAEVEQDTTPPLMDILIRDSKITVTAADGSTSVAGARADNIAGIPGSFARTDGLTDDTDSKSVASELLFTISVPAVSGAKYAIEVVPSKRGRDTLVIQMPSPTSSGMQLQQLPFFAVPGVAVRFVVTVGPEGMTAGRAPTAGVFILPFCSVRHAIINLGKTAIDATYLVEQTGETGSVHLAASGTKQFFSATELRTTTPGTLRLSTSTGTRIASLAPLTSCPH